MGTASTTSPAFSGTVTTSAFFFTRKTWPQRAQVTATPLSGTRSSAMEYWALQRSQRRSMGGNGQGSHGSHLDASAQSRWKN
jgi:hypothetical protein